MTPEQRLVSIVKNAKGDNLERAKRAFGHMTAAELDQEHGQSGQTRRSILLEYENERAEWHAASELLHKLLRR